ncbi:Unknown protein [Striga hermonthica]|uniref:Uncharacterized protein n=1 Tax=Striga hermonthica TaxID=68872 RepID=A0A9N7P252_STRHE|nr:Unknown protein [Striga hermonthica]
MPVLHLNVMLWKALLPPHVYFFWVSQELLRKLQSIYSSVTNSSQNSVSNELSDEFFSGDQEQYKAHHTDVEYKYLSARMSITAKDDDIVKISRQRAPCFWWFRNIRLKLGNTQIEGFALLASLLLLIYYFARRKQATLKR